MNNSYLWLFFMNKSVNSTNKFILNSTLTRNDYLLPVFNFLDNILMQDETHIFYELTEKKISRRFFEY